MINSVVNTGSQPAVKVRENAVGSVAENATTSQPAKPQESSVPDAGQLKVAVRKLNDYVQSVQRNLSFSVDKASGETVIKVYDAQTNEVIRQIPADETLRLAASIDERLSSLSVKEKV